MSDSAGSSVRSEQLQEPVPGLHRVRMDVLLGELVNRAGDIIGVEKQMHQLLDAVVSVASGHTVDETLHRLTELAAELSGAEFSALRIAGPDPTLDEFITAGVDPHLRSAVGGVRPGQDGPVRLIHGLESGFPPENPRAGTFLGVPIRIRDVLFGDLYLTYKRDGGFTERDEDLVVALASAAGIAIENARLVEETRRRERWLAASAEVTSSLLAGAEAAETTQLVVRKAAEIVHADAVFLLLRDENDPVDGHGLGALVVRAAHGEGAAAFLGQQYALNETLAGQVFADGKPRPYVSRAAMMKSISATAPPHGRLDGPGVLIPLASAGHNLGVLSVARFRGSDPFTKADVRMVHTFAGNAALAVEFSRVARDKQRLAVYQDRDRIARDLHDLVIQHLFAIGFGLQGVLPKVTQPEVVDTLSGYVDDLDTTIRDVRKTIFSLQESEEEASGLRGRILRTVAGAAIVLGFEPSLTMAGPVDSVVTEALGAQLLAMIGESLTNVARHAQASRVDVRVSVDTSARTVTAVILDDGIGPRSSDVPGQGTVNMEARARQVGGAFTLCSGESGGAEVTWSAPLGLPA